MISIRATHLLWLIPAGMLIAALAPWPYAYYRLLRWVVFVCCAVIAYQSFERRGFSPWLIGVAALLALFNPVVPIHLTRAIWAPIDLGAAVFLISHGWLNKDENGRG